jgi:hypothetical protein
MRWLARAAVVAALASVAVPAQEIHAPFQVTKYFSAAGWMSDGARATVVLQFDENYTGRPRPGDTDGRCIRISWTPRGSSWAGLYWQWPKGNWGSQPGRSVVGGTKVTFWAVGETGLEAVEFRAGGLRTAGGAYHDSFGVVRGLRLSTSWRQYEISLRGQNLTSVIGAFAWILHRDGNPATVTFYLDDIRYE